MSILYLIFMRLRSAYLRLEAELDKMDHSAFVYSPFFELPPEYWAKIAQKPKEEDSGESVK